jgi:hypothetical protein
MSAPICGGQYLNERQQYSTFHERIGTEMGPPLVDIGVFFAPIISTQNVLLLVQRL